MKPIPRSNVEGLLAQAKSLVPDGPSVPLPPMDGFPDIPQWHHFEHSLWSIGEQIRQALNSQPKLRGDHSLYAAYRPCVAWATDLASLLPDSEIDGHIISALYKMRAPGFSATVAPFLSSTAIWIRKEARRYMSFDLDAPIPNERSA
jgi:hypothetical protein